MANQRKLKAAHLAAEKMGRVLTHGCHLCGKGAASSGFEQYWDDFQYDPRRFVFKYADPQPGDVPVAQLPKSSTVTVTDIDEALTRCVILCRSCADPRRTRKEVTQCPEKTTTACPTSSYRTSTGGTPPSSATTE